MFKKTKKKVGTELLVGQKRGSNSSAFEGKEKTLAIGKKGG